MSVVWEPTALDEFDAALAASKDAGRFREVVNDALALIQANPQLGSAAGRRSVRRYVLTGRLPYSIVYTEAGATIRVLAFPHGSRKPGYWKNRLPKI